MGRRKFNAADTVVDTNSAVQDSDPHLGWLEQWYQARADWIVAADNDPSGDSSSPECLEATNREYAVRDQIITTKVRTMEGANAQVTFLIADQWDNLKGEYGLDFIHSILEKLATENQLARRVAQ